jgi:asparagine synthase (glutamine-hydrolysing)
MVKEVLPGNYLVVDSDHITRQKRYWAPAVCRFSGTYQDAVLKLRGLLEQSVEDRLVADVEVGSFLSGGLDSSIVAAIANKKRGGGLKTFTIGFEEKSYNESEFARIAARHIGSTHEEKILTGFDPALLEDMLLNKVGQPFHDSSILPTSLVSQLASNHVKVSLSGDGADELFCGYQRYKARYLMRLYSKAPKALREIFRKMISRFPENRQHHSRSLLKKAHLFMDAVDRYEAETPYFAPTFFSNEMYDELFNLKYESEPEIDCFVSSLLDKSENEIKRMMTADTFIYLPQDIHTKVDRASMACSLEARAPFMSTEIVEFALSLPTKYTLSWKNNKQILVDSFRDLLPSDIWRRSKQGFAVPLSFWFHQELGDRLLRLLDEDNGLSAVINLAMARHLLDVHRSGLRDYGYRLWLIYTYAVWRSRSPLLQCG